MKNRRIARADRGGASAPASRVSSPSWANSRAAALAAAVICAALALWVYRRALGAFFTTDDFLLLEQARGLRAYATGPWRWLPGHAYFSVLTPFADAHPLPYHLVNWCLHALNAALLFTWLARRGMKLPFALLAAGLFGASRLQVLDVSPVTGVGELLALGFGLGALLAADASGLPSLGLAGLLFGAALLSKENVLLLPLVLLVPAPAAAQPAGAGARGVVTRASVLLALSAAFVGLLAWSHVFSGSLGGNAYAVGFGGNVLENLGLYSRWITNLTSPAPDSLAPQAGAESLGGLWLLVALGGLSLALWRRARWIAVGSAWWLATLLPVLPLMGHAYLHYLYAPSAGLAIAIAGALAWALEALVPRRAATAAAWALAAGVLAIHAANADRLLAARQSARMQGLDLPADPYFRKCAVSRNAIADLSQALEGASHVRMLVFEPPGSGFTYDAITGERLEGPRAGTHQYSLLEAVLDGGLALRAVFPQVDTVAFAPRWTPAYDSFSLYTYNLEGHVAYLGDGPAGQLRLAQMMVEFERWDAAREHLSAVVARYPDDADLRYLNARVLEHANDRPGAIRELQELLRRTPGSPRAAEAGSLLARLREGRPEGK